MRRILPLLALLSLILAPMAPGAAVTTTCADPAFVTSNPNGMWSNRGYVVHNNMWNASGYNVKETLSACSFKNWYVKATANNSSGDGAVKTYPNVHKDFHNWSTGAEPRLSSFKTIRSTYAAASPRVGIYNVAYDIWLNGVPGNREVMIWTDNHNQVPAGSKVAGGVSLSGHTWKVYATSGNGYIAFVPSERIPHGTLRLKQMLNWLVAKGRVPARSTLGQICFGVEVVSTGGNAATFNFSDFSVTTTRK
ncbi:MAG: GH12 family glycosyl hydrolase domain-containing protein [Nocardioidaceae bacterium]